MSFVIESKFFAKMMAIIECEGKNHEGKGYALVKDVFLNVNSDNIFVEYVDVEGNIGVRIHFDADIKKEGTIPISIAAFKKFKKLIKGYSSSNDKIKIELNDKKKIVITRGSPKRKRNTLGTGDEIQSLEGIDEIPFDFVKGNYIAEKIDDDGNVIRSTTLDTKIVTDVSELKEVLSDSNILDNRVFKFIVDPKKFKTSFLVQIGEKDEDNSRVEVPGEVKTKDGKISKGVYGYGAHCIFTSLDGEINMYYKGGSHLIVTKKGENFSAEFQISRLELEQE